MSCLLSGNSGENSPRPAIRNKRLDGILCRLFIGMMMIWGTLYAQPDTLTAGFRDFNYGNSVISTPTGEKPQSKLWFNDESWWGYLWDPAAAEYRIYRFDLPTHTWINTGTAIDERTSSKADVLWDGQHLYVVSHIFSTVSEPTSPDNSARLYRFSYDSGTRTYSADGGFPVIVNSSKSETLTLAKDGTGQLWVTWIEAGNVMVNRSLSGDLDWGTPFSLPSQPDSTSEDDIASIIAFGGNKIGILWSNHNDYITYFSAHNDADADTVWGARENALADALLGNMADDHINLKTTSGGDVYAMVKTSLTGSDPSLYLIKRSAAGAWSRYEYSIFSERLTRPILLIDEADDQIYVFAKSKLTGPEIIYRKTSSLSSISFASGLGTPVIESASDLNIDNVTSTKQNVNDSTGILILAGDLYTHYYFHNYFELSEAPILQSFTPQFAAAGALITLTGRSFTGATSVTFNGSAAASFNVVNDNIIEVTVPDGATSGTITVTTGSGSDTSDEIFEISLPPFDLSTSVTGSGSVDLNPSGGSYNSVTTVTLTAIPDPGYTFVGWSGDLSGVLNPETLYMDRDYTVTANFIPRSSGVGPVVHQETRNGASSALTTVTTDVALTAVSNDVYLAAITTRPLIEADMVSGMGLSWTRLASQCSGRGNTGVEIWLAQGTPAGDEAVTATFPTAPSNAVITVSRYSGVHRITPVDTLISGNTAGLDGDCISGVDNNFYNFGITTLTDGSMVFGAIASRNRTNTPGAGYTELSERSQGAGGVIATLAVQQDDVPTASVKTFNGILSGDADWAVIALALRPGNAVFTLDTSTFSAGSITLDPAGGIYDSATVVTLTANPDAGYIFSGWSGDLSGSTNPETLTMDSDKAVTATFTPRYTLSLDTLGMGGITLDPPGGVYDSATVVTLSASADAGHRFIRWDGDLLGSSSPVNIVMDGHKQIAGIFFPQYDLTTSITGGGSIGLSPAGGTYDSATVVYLTPTPDPGFTFGYWGGDLAGSANPDSLLMNGPKTVTAHFIPRYDLTVNISGFGAVDLSPPGGTYDSASVVVLTALPNAGYGFAGWSGDLSGTLSSDTLVMDGPKTVTASFDEIGNLQFNLTVNNVKGGSVQLNPPGGIYYGNTEVEVIALPDSGYRFRDWDGDLSGSANPDTILIDGHKSITPSFTRRFALTVDTIGLGGVSLSPAGGVYDSATVVTVTATPAPTWIFSGWGGDLAGSLNPATITLDGDRQISATFTALTTITHEATYSDTSSDGAAAFTASPIITAVSGDLYLAAVSTRPFREADSLSGLGLHWTLVAGQCSGRDNTGVEVWMAQGIPTGDGQLTVYFSSNPFTAALTVSRYSGVHGADPVGAVISGNVNGLFALCAGGIDSPAYSLDIATTDEKSFVFGAIAPRNRINEPGAGYLERAEVNVGAGADEIGLAVQDKLIETPATVPFNGTFNNAADWALVALEIRPAATLYTLSTSTVSRGSIQLDPAGGIYDSAAVVTLTALPDSGYVFTGWSGDLSGSVNPESLTMLGNKAVTANFLARFALNVSIDGPGSVSIDPPGGIYDSAAVVTLTAIPDSGYAFAGWSGDSTGSDTLLTLVMDSDKTLQARFLPSYTLTIDTIGFGGVALDPPGGIYDSAHVVTLTAIPDSGYAFAGWGGNLTGKANPDSVAMDSNLVISATFVPAYIITTQISGAGTVQFDPPGAPYDSASVVVLTAVPDSGYIFTGWGGDLSGSANPDSLVMDTNRTVTATFELLSSLTFTVALDTIGAGGIALDPPGGSYSGGTQLILTALPDSAHRFTGWGGDLSGLVNPDTLLIDGNKAVSAGFVRQFVLDIDTIGGGIVNLDPPGAIYDSATVVTMTAIADSGFYFSGWEGDVTGTASERNITMSSDRQVQAVFLSNSHITHEETVTDTVAGSNIIATDSSLTAGNGHLYLAAISTRPFREALALEGLGLSWTLVRSQCSGRSQTGVEVWMAQGTPTGDGPVAAALSGVVSTGVITVSRYSGVRQVDPVATVISGNTNGLNGGCLGGTDSGSYSLNIQTTAGNSIVFGAVAMRNRVNEPGIGYTERAEVRTGSGADEIALAVQDVPVAAPSLRAVNGVLNNPTDWALIGLEIRPSTTLYPLTTQTVSRGSVQAEPAENLYAAGSRVTLTALPDSGYIFTGWSGDLSGSANPDSILMSGPKTVTAGFLARFALSIDTVGNGGVSVNPPGGIYDSAAVVTLTAQPDSGFAFAGWSGSLAGTDTVVNLLMDSDKAVQALFVPGYTLNIDTIGFGGVVLSPAGGVYDSATVVTLTAQPDSGFGFAGWSGDLNSSANPDSIVMDSHKTVTASFVPAHVLTVNLSGGGSVSLNPPGGIYNTGSTVTLSAVADSGFVFSGWSGDLVGSAAVDSILMDADKSVTATFVPLNTLQFSVTLDTLGAGGIVLDPPGGVYAGGTMVRFSAVADSGHRFSGWGGDLAGGANPDSLMIDGDKTVSAGFIRQFALNLSATSGGSAAASPDSSLFDSAAVVTVSASPAPGYNFAGWSGDLSGSVNPETLLMNGDKNVTANFVKASPISFEAVSLDSVNNSTLLSTAQPVIAVAGDLYLVSVSTRPYTTVGAVNGLGLTWSLITSQCSGRLNTGVEVWMAQGTPSGSGTVSVILNGAATNAVMAITRYSGVDSASPIGSVLSANSNGIGGLCSGGTDGNAYEFDYTTTVDKAFLFGAVALRNRIHEPGTNFLERGEISAGLLGNRIGVAVQDRFVEAAGTVKLSGSFNNNTDWAVIGFELKPRTGAFQLSTSAGSGGAIQVDPDQASYDYGDPVTLTAQPSAGYRFGSWGGDLSGSANPASILMTGDKQVSASFIRQFMLTVDTLGMGTVALTVPSAPAAAPAGGSINLQDGGSGAVRPVTGTTPQRHGSDGPGSPAIHPIEGLLSASVYDSGAVVILTATPAVGYEFTGWSGDLSGSANPDTVQLDSNMTVTATFTPTLGAILVNVKAFLEGPYSAGAMRSTLSDSGWLPPEQPYGAAPWNYAGSESVTAMPAGVVDWVLIQLRETQNGAAVASRAALLKSDGSVTDLDGSSAVSFPAMAAGSYFILLHHRNHLGIMSAAAVPLDGAGALYDFSTGQDRAFGSNAMCSLGGGIYGLFTGDANQNGSVEILDKSPVWRQQNGTAWSYGKSGDFNLDGGIDVTDLNQFWRVNQGLSTEVPNPVVTRPGGSGAPAATTPVRTQQAGEAAARPKAAPGAPAAANRQE